MTTTLSPSLVRQRGDQTQPQYINANVLPLGSVPFLSLILFLQYSLMMTAAFSHSRLSLTTSNKSQPP